jgi:hypothetical protein
VTASITSAMSLRAVFALAVAAGASPASAEIVALAWNGNGQFSREFRVPPAKFVELCDKLPAGTKVEWSFEAQGPMNFNVHYHQGKQVHFPAKQDQVSRAEGMLEASTAQDYCWMWTNKGTSDVALTVRLQRN